MVSRRSPGVVLPAVDRVEGVAGVAGVRFSEARTKGLDTGSVSVTGIDPANFERAYRTTIEKGPENAIRALSSGRTAVIKKGFAEDENLNVGQVVTLRTPTRRTVRVRVGGVVKDEGGLFSDLTVSNALLERDFGERKDAIGLVDVAAGAELDQVQGRIAALLKARFPEAEVKTGQELIDSQADQVNQLLGLIYALLSLAVLISLFGIVNTLVLSISERTREIGMLRAIGTTQKQIRRMVRWEAVITALIGAVLGCSLGLALSVLFTRPLDGFKLSIPVGSLAVLVLLAALAGVAAAAWPARRAAKLDVLKALAYE